MYTLSPAILLIEIYPINAHQKTYTGTYITALFVWKIQVENTDGKYPIAMQQ